MSQRENNFKKPFSTASYVGLSGHLTSSASRICYAEIQHLVRLPRESQMEIIKNVELVCTSLNFATLHFWVHFSRLFFWVFMQIAQNTGEVVLGMCMLCITFQGSNHGMWQYTNLYSIFPLQAVQTSLGQNLWLGFGLDRGKLHARDVLLCTFTIL